MTPHCAEEAVPSESCPERVPMFSFLTEDPGGEVPLAEPYSTDLSGSGGRGKGLGSGVKSIHQSSPTNVPCSPDPLVLSSGSEYRRLLVL